MRHLLTLTTLVAIMSLSAVARAQELTTEEAHLVDLVNQARVQAGLNPLAPDLQLSAVARSHSLDMAQHHFFSHVSPTTGDMGDRLRAANVSFGRAAENIALDASVDAAHLALMNSPHHRENLLDPEYTRIGIGVIRIGDRVVVTQAFMRPRSTPTQVATAEPAPSGSREAAPEPAAQAPAPETQGRPLTSPFDLIGLLTGQSSQQLPQDASAAPPAEDQQEAEAPAATDDQQAPAPAIDPAHPAPGLWLVGQDGSWHRIELNPELLLRLLNVQ